MHSSDFKIKISSYPKDYFVSGTMHHNGDWSGEVIINFDKNTDERDGFPKEIRMPAALLLQLSHKAVVQKVTSELISFLEQMDIEYTPPIATNHVTRIEDYRRDAEDPSRDNLDGIEMMRGWLRRLHMDTVITEDFQDMSQDEIAKRLGEYPRGHKREFKVKDKP